MITGKTTNQTIGQTTYQIPSEMVLQIVDDQYLATVTHIKATGTPEAPAFSGECLCKKVYWLEGNRWGFAS